MAMTKVMKPNAGQPFNPADQISELVGKTIGLFRLRHPREHKPRSHRPDAHPGFGLFSTFNHANPGMELLTCDSAHGRFPHCRVIVFGGQMVLKIGPHRHIPHKQAYRPLTSQLERSRRGVRFEKPGPSSATIEFLGPCTSRGVEERALDVDLPQPINAKI
jgi:hypothetical protein